MSKTVKLLPMSEWEEISSIPDDWDQVGRDELLRMYSHLNLVRAFEEEVLQVNSEGLIHGPAHSSIGQDGGAVGAISCLRNSDQISGAHRGHHQFLAKILNYVDGQGYKPLDEPMHDAIRLALRKTMAEIMGLGEGFCKGRGGSMHLRWRDAGALGTNAIVGGGVPFANGVAWALKRKGDGDVVFTFFGDGGVNIGSVPESLNLAALWNLPICFFIENNGFAVSTTLEEETRETRMSSRGLAYGIPAFRVDGMDPVAVRLAAMRATEIMRSGKGPVIIEAMVYRFTHHGGNLPGSAFGYRTKDQEAEWRGRDPLIRMGKELEERGWLAAGDSDLIQSISRDSMREIANSLTESDGNHRKIPNRFWPDIRLRDHGLRGDLSEFDDVQFEDGLGLSAGELQEKKFIQVVADVMNRRMEMDERIFCIGEDIHRMRGGTNGATRGLAERFPDRIVPTPIAEAGFSGLAGGVAMEGTYRPVVELMYPDFALVAADQLFNQIGKARHMFGGETAMPLVLRTKIAIGTGYGSQHSMDPAGLFFQWPGWRIVAPSTPYDYVGLMNSALRCEDPVLVIEHVKLYETTGLVPPHNLDYFIPLGQAKVVREGTAVTILTYLAMVGLAVEAAAQTSIDAEIIDLRSLDRAGLDWETIGRSIQKTNNVIILEQGPLTVSYGAFLSDEVQRRYFDWLDQPVKRVHGGESSPAVSKVLERAAYVGLEEISSGLYEAMREIGAMP